MRVEPVEIYSDKTNLAVLRHPSRRFPGMLIQGDDLYVLSCAADEARLESGESEPGFWMNRLREVLHARLDHYKNVLDEHGIPMPFDDRLHTAHEGETK